MILGQLEMRVRNIVGYALDGGACIFSPATAEVLISELKASQPEMLEVFLAYSWHDLKSILIREGGAGDLESESEGQVGIIRHDEP